MRRHRGSAAWLLVWAALAAAPTQAGLDRSIERMMGREAREAIESEYRVVETPVVHDFVDRVGQRVAAVSPRKMTYTIRVIESDEVNAMALPSGDIYVTTGLLAFADGQDELAGVLGHEIGHVAAKHSLRSFKKQFWAGVVFGVVKMPSGLETAGQLATTLYFLRYSRKDEAEADRLGAQIALDAGYDPFALRVFMGRLAEAREERLSTVETWFTTHPEPERRFHRLGELKQLDATRLTTVATIGSGYLDRHFAGAAVLRLRRAAALAPDDAQVQLRLAQAAAAAGLADEAARHAARAAELDGGLAEEAQRIEQTAQADADPDEPAPADVEEQAAQRLTQVEASREAATAASQALSERLAETGQKRKEVADRAERLGRELTDAASTQQVTGERRAMLQRSATVLNEIEKVIGRLGGVAKASAEASKQTETTGTTLAERLKSAQAPATKARLVECADRYVAGVERRQAAHAAITEQADEAMAALSAAAKHLGEAIDALSSSGGLGFSSELGLGAARTSLEAAEKETKQAAAAADRASALQSEAMVTETAWQLDMETLTLSPATHRQLDEVVGGYLGAEAEAVREARREAGGLGSAALRLMATPPAEGEGEAEDPEALKPEQQPGVAALMTLLCKDVKREMAAAKRAAEDPEAQEPTVEEAAE